MFVGKAEATKVTSTLKTFAGDKHPSLINLNVTDLRKKSFIISTSAWPSATTGLQTGKTMARDLQYKPFFAVIDSPGWFSQMFVTSSSVVEHSPRHPMVKGLSPAPAAGTMICIIKLFTAVIDSLV